MLKKYHICMFSESHAGTQKSEGTLWDLVLSFNQVGCQGLTEVIEFGNECFNPLSYPEGSVHFFLCPKSTYYSLWLVEKCEPLNLKCKHTRLPHEQFLQSMSCAATGKDLADANSTC